MKADQQGNISTPPIQMRVAIVLALIALCGCSARRDIQQPLTLRPAPVGAAADFVSVPQLSVNGGHVVLSWVENNDETSTLRFADYRGGAWTAPRTAATGNNWYLTPADVPSVMRLDDSGIVAEYLQTTDEAAEAYDLLLTFSNDDGRTWSAPVSPHHDGTKTQHGFASLYQLVNGPLGLIWLDGRATRPDGGGNMHVRAALFDRHGTQTSESLVDDRVCECCPTSIAIGTDGPIAAFRDRSATEVRNIAVSRLVHDAWTPSAIVHDDDWKIEGCPVNGPAIAARGRNVAVAWFTGKDDQGRAWAAWSADGGVTFAPPIRLDDEGSLGRVGVAMLDDRTAAAIWVESANGKTELRLRQLDASGRRGPSQVVAPFNGDHARGYPRIASVGDELLLAWNEVDKTKTTVRTVASAVSR